jgi:23S rRNA (adenine2503-C2)-methyltransferase
MVESSARESGFVPGHLGALRERLRGLGAAAPHEGSLLRNWIAARPLDAGRRRADDFLPARVREALPQLCEDVAAIARLDSRHPAPDGSERLLVRLADGQTVESVLLPRDGLCVSTQVGCAVGCGFCMTGQGGLVRQLGSAEIAAQVALARRFRRVRKVVFMGMGEPAHNLEAVLEAIDFLGGEGGIGHKNLVFSTVGDARVFERLPTGRVRPALALSLHTTRADLRATLLPRAPRIDPAELLAQGVDYARATGYPLQVQWTLLRGVNDSDAEVEALVSLLRGQPAMLNLILYNTVDGLPWERPPMERAIEMTRSLNRGGVLTRMRHSAGQDVEGGCGQLRARAQGAAASPVLLRRRVPDSRAG